MEQLPRLRAWGVIAAATDPMPPWPMEASTAAHRHCLMVALRQRARGPAAYLFPSPRLDREASEPPRRPGTERRGAPHGPETGFVLGPGFAIWRVLGDPASPWRALADEEKSRRTAARGCHDAA